eukprot:9277805-Pyramimonas_sp.AAC.1
MAQGGPKTAPETHRTAREGSMELLRRSQWRSPHASATPSTAFCGPMGSSTEGPSGAARVRLPHPVH